MPANLAHRFLIVLTCVFGCAALLIGTAVSAEPDSVRVTTAGRSFTVETRRLRVTFEDGMIVTLENLQTGERHADAGLDDLGMPRGMDPLLVDRIPRLPSWTVSLVMRDRIVDGFPTSRAFTQLTRPSVATVLARVVVAFEDVPPTERHGRRRQPVVICQRDHLGHAQPEPYGADEPFAFRWPQFGPVFPRVGLVIAWVYDASRLVPQHDQRTGHGGHVYRLPVAVQHQCGTLQDLAEKSLSSRRARSRQFLRAICLSRCQRCMSCLR
jgi:hypothetical protein